MKKSLLLAGFILIGHFAYAQVDTLFRETFETVDSVTTGNIGTATGLWNDTSNVSISGSDSYHARVEPAATGSNSSEVIFTTDSFSTVGYSFCFLEFYHICKINQVNQGLIRVSTDNGATWTLLQASNVNYLGTGNWNSSSNFQEASYNIPNQGLNTWFSGTDPTVANSWWVQEKFDISNLVFDANGAGYSQVKIQFSAYFVLNPTQISGRPFGAGWWVDNLMVTASTCELFPPRFRFNYNPAFTSPSGKCFPVQPTGGLTQNQSNSYKIGARATDSVPGGTNSTNFTGIDSVTVFYRIIDDTTGVGPWQYVNMTSVNTTYSEYEASISQVYLGDTVQYYYKAWDKACPNITRFPDSIANPANPYLKFWPQPGLPFKCGAPDCGSLPGTISSFPWIEDFEGPEWVPGSGVGDNGTTHRGDFPDEQTGQAYWQVFPGTNTSGYAWSLRQFGTATPFTGPTGNNTPTGATYIYAESSQGAQNSTTSLITPCIDLTQVTKCYAFEFYYHFFGEDVGALRIDVDTGSTTPAWYNGYFRLRKQQQDAQTDPWERALVPLKEFNGQFIRLRFVSAKQTSKTGSLARGDMALDDFRIYEPTPVDAEILEITGPAPGLCSYGNEDLEMVIRNNGCDSLKTVPIQYILTTNGTPGTVQNGSVNVNLRTGDTTTVSLASALNLTAFGNYQVEAWVNVANDTVPDNDSAISTVLVHEAAFNTFPHVTDFENATVGSSNTSDSLWIGTTGLDPNFGFEIGNRFTDTRNTGPRGGYYKTGNYIFTEADNSTGNVASYLETKRCVDLTGINNPVLDFYYHMLGSNIEKIDVQVNEPIAMGPDNYQVVTGSVVIPFGQNSPMSDFQFKRVDLSAYAGKSIKIRIAAHRKNAGTEADIALDKIMLYDAIANDAGVELMLQFLNGRDLYSLASNTPMNNALPAAIVPYSTVRNFGTGNLSGESVTYRVTPLCGPNAGVPTVYNSTSTFNVSSTQSSQAQEPNLGLVLPDGACEVCAYTSVAGDTYAFNDTACRILTGKGTYDADFYDDFDSCNYEQSGYFTQGGFEQWEFGVAPSTSKFHSGQTGDNIWATNLTDGYYIDATREILVMPNFDNFDTVVSPTIRMFMNNDMGPDAAGTIEYNIGGWKTLGATTGSFQNVGLNWYNQDTVGGTLSSPVNGIDEGFSGSSTTAGNPSGWFITEYPMSELNFEPNAIPMRFKFESNAFANTSRSFDGWAIDDFEVFIPPQNSATPADFRFIKPLQIPTQDQPIDVIIQNTGAKLLDSCEVKLEILPPSGGTPTWQGQWQKVILPRFFIKESRYTLRYNEVWPGANVTPGQHTLRMITRRPNGKRDNAPLDDTTEVIVNVLQEYTYDVANGDTAYCNDFEGASLPFVPLNSRTYSRGPYSWENGTPVQFPGAFSGNNAWMTGLNENYKFLDNSALITPVFVVDTGVSYEINFMHYFETEKYHDGGNLEVTLDGGLNWNVIGFANEDDWYNTEFVTSLDIIKPGWTDTSGGWDSARYVVAFDTATDRAVFRFRFESDFAFQDAGWAIDDFCMTATNERPQVVIGDEEFNPAPSTFVGTLNPNPTADLTRLPLFVGQPEQVSIRVVNVLGQEVTSRDESLDPGSNTLVFETFEWTPGVYFVNIEIAGKRLTRKLVVR